METLPLSSYILAGPAVTFATLSVRAWLRTSLERILTTHEEALVHFPVIHFHWVCPGVTQQRPSGLTLLTAAADSCTDSLLSCCTGFDLRPVGHHMLVLSVTAHEHPDSVLTRSTDLHGVGRSVRLVTKL